MVANKVQNSNIGHGRGRFLNSGTKEIMVAIIIQKLAAPRGRILNFGSKKDNGSSAIRLGRNKKLEIVRLDLREESKGAPPNLKCLKLKTNDMYIYIYMCIYLSCKKKGERNMNRTCVNKSNAKCIENESGNLHSKGKPHPRG